MQNDFTTVAAHLKFPCFLNPTQWKTMGDQLIHRGLAIADEMEEAGHRPRLAHALTAKSQALI